jgi:hypothetical protein
VRSGASRLLTSNGWHGGREDQRKLNLCKRTASIARTSCGRCRFQARV